MTYGVRRGDWGKSHSSPYFPAFSTCGLPTSQRGGAQQQPTIAGLRAIQLPNGRLPVDFNEIADFVAKNPWFTIAGFALTIVFGIVSVILYFRPQHVTKPSYALRNYNLIHDG